MSLFEKVMVMLPNKINNNMFLCIKQVASSKGALAVNESVFSLTPALNTHLNQLLKVFAFIH